MDIFQGLKDFIQKIEDFFNGGSGFFGTTSSAGSSSPVQAPELATNPYAAQHDYSQPALRPVSAGYAEQAPAPVEDRSPTPVRTGASIGERLVDTFRRSVETGQNQIGHDLQNAGHRLAGLPGQLVTAIGNGVTRKIEMAGKDFTRKLFR